MYESRLCAVALFLMASWAALLAPYDAQAQKNVRLRKADEARRGGRGENRFDRVIGNVIFSQNETTIYCDSAHYYKRRNALEAFGRVRIHEGDSIRITGSRLEYEGDSRTAKMRGNVVFRKLGGMTLYTDNLDFSRNNNTAYYYNGGRLVDSTTTLTSRTGRYDLSRDLATFKQNVKVTNPDYTMTADSLQYNSRTKVIHFITKTTVVQKDGTTFTYGEGYYDTRTQRTDVARGHAESEEYSMKSLDFEYDGIRQVGKARGNVVMTHKQENLIIYSQATDYYEKLGITKIYDNAYVAKVGADQDTLFISADTLVSVESDDSTKKRLLAYGNVRIYKSDMQGVADSVEYRSADSTIYFYQQPVLWSNANQMSADSIWMKIEGNTVREVYLVDNAFVISQDTLQNFNQIKGRLMRADIRDNQIDQVYVNGNGESIYFALDEESGSTMGMNRLICSSMTIRFRDGKVDNISFYVQPDAQFIPPHELKPDVKRLKGFSWKVDLKPTREQVVKPQLAKEKGKQ